MHVFGFLFCYVKLGRTTSKIETLFASKWNQLIHLKNHIPLQFLWIIVLWTWLNYQEFQAIVNTHILNVLTLKAYILEACT